VKEHDYEYINNAYGIMPLYLELDNLFQKCRLTQCTDVQCSNIFHTSYSVESLKNLFQNFSNTISTRCPSVSKAFRASKDSWMVLKVEHSMRFYVLTEVNIEISVFWSLTPCRFLYIFVCIGTSCLHFQDTCNKLSGKSIVKYSEGSVASVLVNGILTQLCLL
jgi:hypothetical protein